MAVIKVKKFLKEYKQKRRKIRAVDEISFTVEKGKIYGFLGPNGAGKTTTIKAMMGLIRPTQGHITINGIEASRPEARKSLGFLPENPTFPEAITGWELLKFSARMHETDENQIHFRASELLKRLSMEDAVDKPVRKYSKGMVQKIGFASVLIHDPDVLVLDEPMSGLDPIGRFTFKEILKECRKRGKTIFFSSHIIPDVEDLCDRVIVINKGKVIATLDMETIRTMSTSSYEIVFKTPENITHHEFECEVIEDSIKKIKIESGKIFEVLDLLKNHKVDLLSIQPISENLETIFIKLTSQNQDR